MFRLMIQHCWYILVLFVLLFLTACIKDPNTPFHNNFIAGKNGAFILCEGRMNYNNATLTRIDFETNSHSVDYFSEMNAGQKLGDVGNDINLYNHNGYVAVSNSGTIEVFALSTGKSLGRLIFPKYVMPRKICFVNDTLAFVTAYIALSDSNFYIYHFNPKDLSLSQKNIDDNKIIVGSHPEGIAYCNNKIYVVNSGYGDYYQLSPIKSSTISVIDINSKKEINCIPTEFNPNRIYCRNNKIYVVYWGSPSDKKHLPSGIIEYDANTMNVLRKWETTVYDVCFNEKADTLFYLSSALDGNSATNNSTGVKYIALNETNAIPQQFIENKNKNEIWTAIAINSYQNEIWIANSFNFQVAGEVIVYDLKYPYKVKKRIQTGQIPGTIVFY